MIYWLILTPWAGPLLWLVLAFADYYMTLLGAKLYHQGVSDHIEFSGSYELNPIFQKEIDSQTKLSPKFVIGSLVVAVLLIPFWYYAFYYAPYRFGFGAYSILLGAILLPRLVVVGVHIDNILRFRTMNLKGGLTGKITYARRLAYRFWQFRLGGYGGLFILIFALTWEFFFLGGAAMCFLFILRFGSWAKNTLETQTTPTE